MIETSDERFDSAPVPVARLEARGRALSGLAASAPLRILIATAAVMASLLAGAFATPPITLVYETRVAVEIKLVVTDSAGKRHEAGGTLRGLAGERLVFAESLPTSDGAFGVGVLIEARPHEESGLCRIHVESDIRAGEASAVHLARDARTEAGRLLLMDVWSDEETGARAVIALTTTWEKVPSLTTLVAGAEPLELVVEVLLGGVKESRVVERHRLGGVVGAPIRYTFRQLPGSTASVVEGGKDEAGQLEIEVLPREISDGQADLDIRLNHVGTSPYSQVASMNLAVRERLAPGYSVSLPLPRGAEGMDLVFRVTPYF